MMNMKHVLQNAEAEIIGLRRRNEILEAKVEMIDLFELLLHTTPAAKRIGEGEDVASDLRVLLSNRDFDAEGNPK